MAHVPISGCCRRVEPSAGGALLGQGVLVVLRQQASQQRSSLLEFLVSSCAVPVLTECDRAVRDMGGLSFPPQVAPDHVLYHSGSKLVNIVYSHVPAEPVPLPLKGKPRGSALDQTS